MVAGAVALWLVPDAAAPQDSRLAPTNVEITGHVAEPQLSPASPDLVARLRVPEGFRVSVFASGVGMPRILAVADQNTVYVTRRTPGDLIMLKDTDGNGMADVQRIVATRLHLHGITIHRGRLYAVTINEVFSAILTEDGPVNWERLVTGLPDAGQHPNRTIRIGPDGMLYVAVGSTCNECNEPDPRNGTLQQVDPASGTLRTYAGGLRNTIGFDWHPTTSELWGMDHGIDWLGDTLQHEELNQIRQGRHYGWPYVFDDRRANPHTEPPPPLTADSARQTSTSPALMYTAHAAPMQMQFYAGDMFPAEYRGDAFVAMRGSWNRSPPSGYEVVRIRFSNGQPRAFEPFLRGFLYLDQQLHARHFGRPAGLAVMPDGALLVGDDTNGMIYRITYGGRP